MPDLLRTAELAAKAIRNGFALLGAMADACIPAKVNVYRELYQAADALAEREAEEEVAEPWAPPGGNSQTLIWASSLSATSNDEPSDEALNNITGLCCCYDPRVVQPCGPCRLGDGPCVNLPQSPAAMQGAGTDPGAGSPPAPAPGVSNMVRGPIEATEDWFVVPRGSFSSPLQSADLAEPSPAPEFDWVTWAIPAITDVLAEHHPCPCSGTADLYNCGSHFGYYLGESDWREHVAPIIAARIYTAASQK